MCVLGMTKKKAYIDSPVLPGQFYEYKAPPQALSDKQAAVQRKKAVGKTAPFLKSSLKFSWRT